MDGHRLVYGCDPGISGCIAAMVDGHVVELIDTPVRPRSTGGNDEVNVSALAVAIKEVRARYVGASELAVIENVQPMPNQKDRKGMGAVSAFQYGRTVQSFHAVFELLGIPRELVHASRWKKDVGMPTRAQIEDDAQRKDYARTLVIQRHPYLADQLKTKSHGQPRAEAVLIASWAQLKETGALAPAEAFALTNAPGAVA